MARLTVQLFVLVMFLGACANEGADDEAIRVFAASSLTDVLPEIADLYEATGPAVEINTAGSSALREQILDGADADVFISANEDVMSALVESGEVEGTPVEIATNSMVIVTPRGSGLSNLGLGTFADQELRIGLCSAGVPCGDLAIELLASAGVEPAIDTYEQNVRALIGKVELGELDAALVYHTDAIASDEVIATELDVTSPNRTVYLAAVLSGHADRGDAFLAHLVSPEVVAMFSAAGFGQP